MYTHTLPKKHEHFVRVVCKKEQRARKSPGALVQIGSVYGTCTCVYRRLNLPPAVELLSRRVHRALSRGTRESGDACCGATNPNQPLLVAGKFGENGQYS
jgi:hypothetical protein